MSHAAVCTQFCSNEVAVPGGDTIGVWWGGTSPKPSEAFLLLVTCFQKGAALEAWPMKKRAESDCAATSPLPASSTTGTRSEPVFYPFTRLGNLRLPPEMTLCAACVGFAMFGLIGQVGWSWGRPHAVHANRACTRRRFSLARAGDSVL